MKTLTTFFTLRKAAEGSCSSRQPSGLLSLRLPLLSLIALIVLVTSENSLGQKIRGSSHSFMPRDMVKLKNGDSETGKIIFYDSTKILLQKIDYSQKNILCEAIDTITGLSHFTWFFSPSIGYTHWNGLISQRLDTFSRDATDFRLKFGYMRKKHFAANLDLGLQLGNKHSIYHAGGGVRWYVFSNYVNRKSFYLGLNFGYNFPFTNMNRFFDLGWCAGYEYHWKDRCRIFLEYDKGGAQKYDPHPSYASLNVGIRFSIEYKNYYRELNNKLGL